MEVVLSGFPAVATPWRWLVRYKSESLENLFEGDTSLANMTSKIISAYQMINTITSSWADLLATFLNFTSSTVGLQEFQDAARVQRLSRVTGQIC